MSINYEKSFKKLVEQIKLETGWSEEQVGESNKSRPDLKGLKKLKGLDFEYEILSYGRSSFDRGQLCAYRSILELAEMLEKGEIEFGD